MIKFTKNEIVKIESLYDKYIQEMTNTALAMAINHAKEGKRVIYIIDNATNIKEFYATMQKIANKVEDNYISVTDLDIVVFKAESTTTIYNKNDLHEWKNDFEEVIDTEDTLFIIDSSDFLKAEVTDSNLKQLQEKLGCNLLITMSVNTEIFEEEFRITTLVPEPLKIDPIPNEETLGSKENSTTTSNLRNLKREDIFYTVENSSTLVKRMLEEAVEQKGKGYLVHVLLEKGVVLSSTNYYAKLQQVVLQNNLPFDLVNPNGVEIYADKEKIDNLLENNEDVYERNLQEGKKSMESAFIISTTQRVKSSEDEKRILQGVRAKRYPNTKFIVFAQSEDGLAHRNIHHLGCTEVN